MGLIDWIGVVSGQRLDCSCDCHRRCTSKCPRARLLLLATGETHCARACARDDDSDEKLASLHGCYWQPGVQKQPVPTTNGACRGDIFALHSPPQAANVVVGAERARASFSMAALQCRAKACLFRRLSDAIIHANTTRLAALMGPIGVALIEDGRDYY